MDNYQDYSVEQLQKLVPTLSADEAKQAKLAIFAQNSRKFEVEAEKWREAQMPENMANPVVVEITPLRDGDHANGGVALCNPRVPGARKLRPGERVCLDAEWDLTKALLRNMQGQPYGSVSMCQPGTEATRPAVYPGKNDARCTRPEKRAAKKESEAGLMAGVEARESALVNAINQQLANHRKPQTPSRDEGRQEVAESGSTVHKAKTEKSEDGTVKRTRTRE